MVVYTLGLEILGCYVVFQEGVDKLLLFCFITDFFIISEQMELSGGGIPGSSRTRCRAITRPYKAIVQKQSVIFTERIDLSLGDDGRKKLPEVFRTFAPCLKTRAM